MDMKELLDFDPLAEAEKLTGESYKESDETSKLGLLISMIHNQQKEEILRGLGDTIHYHSLTGYIEIVESVGFKNALTIKIEGTEDRRKSREIKTPRTIKKENNRMDKPMRTVIFSQCSIVSGAPDSITINSPSRMGMLMGTTRPNHEPTLLATRY